MRAKLVTLPIVTGAASPLAEVKPSALFGDHTVLHSGVPVPVPAAPFRTDRWPYDY